MSEAKIPTYADRMRDHVEAAINSQNFPAWTEDFKKQLIAACAADVGTISQLADLLSLAQGAFAVADAGFDEISVPWYRERGRQLLWRAAEALAVIEADREPRPIAGLN